MSIFKSAIRRRAERLLIDHVNQFAEEEKRKTNLRDPAEYSKIIMSQCRINEKIALLRLVLGDKQMNAGLFFAIPGVESCEHFSSHQGRNFCILPISGRDHCTGKCVYFKEK